MWFFPPGQVPFQPRFTNLNFNQSFGFFNPTFFISFGGGATGMGGLILLAGCFGPWLIGFFPISFTSPKRFPS